MALPQGMATRGGGALLRVRARVRVRAKVRDGVRVGVRVRVWTPG